MTGADRKAQALGIPGERLMEQAGTAVAAAARALVEFNGREGRPVLILAGPGNNGGDGFVAARRLAEWGLPVIAVLVAAGERPGHAGRPAQLEAPGRRRPGSPGSTRRSRATSRSWARASTRPRSSWTRCSAPGSAASSGSRSAPPSRSIRKAREAGIPVLAVDTPTAVDLTSGDPSDPVVRADLTVTFHRPKTGLRTRMGRALAGRVLVAPIGIPRRGGPWLRPHGPRPASPACARSCWSAPRSCWSCSLAAGATALLPHGRPGGRLPHAAAASWCSWPGRPRPVADPPHPGRLTRADPVTDHPTPHVTRPPLARRGADLERLGDERWDLLIVGGGIIGAGALLDAVSRGLRVALVEQDDIAAGTSSRSSRLIHGGLRYLQQGEVEPRPRGARASAPRLLRLAPHLVRLEAFLFPIYGPPAVTRAFYTAGLTGYDLLGSAQVGRAATGTWASPSTPGVRAEPPAQGPAGRAAVPRRDGGRRPLRARGRPHGARAGGRGGRRRHAGAGDEARSRDGDRFAGRRRSRTSRPAPPSTSGPRRCSTRPASGARCRSGRSARGSFDRACPPAAATW